MYILLTDKNIVAEIIPDENPIFPGVPIEDRYTAEFISKLIHVSDDTAVEQNWEYVDGKFVEPVVEIPDPIEEIVEK